MNRITRTAAAACAALTMAALLPQTSFADARYRGYAKKLLGSLPAGAKMRPDLETYLNRRANAERARSGRPRLKASKALVQAARAQAAEMYRGNFVGHHSKGGFSFGDRFRAYLPEFEGTRGENAARDRRGGSSSKAKADRVFKQWLDSGGHRRNLIKSDYRFVSSGVIEVGKHLYAVQIFWEPHQPRASINQLLIN